jgi:hypothetical protein
VAAAILLNRRYTLDLARAERVAVRLGARRFGAGAEAAV